MSESDATKIVVELDEEWDTKDDEVPDDVLHVSVATDYQFQMFYNAVLSVMARIGMR